MGFESYVDAIFRYVWTVSYTTFLQLLILFGPAVILGFLMNSLAGFVEGRAYGLMGRRWYLGLFGWLGTIVHEGSHALFCLLFGHEIRDIKWFDLDGHGGALGAVHHAYDRANFYQTIGNFFIGIAPLIGGTLVVYYSSRYLLGPDLFSAMSEVRIDSESLGSLGGVAPAVKTAFSGFGAVLEGLLRAERLLSWRFLLFLYVTFSVGSSIRLSRSDLRGAALGFGVLVILLALFNFVTVWMGESITDLFKILAGSYSVFLSVMLFALLMNGVAAACVLILPAGRGAGRKMAAVATKRSSRG